MEPANDKVESDRQNAFLAKEGLKEKEFEPRFQHDHLKGFNSFAQKGRKSSKKHAKKSKYSYFSPEDIDGGGVDGYDVHDDPTKEDKNMKRKVREQTQRIFAGEADMDNDGDGLIKDNIPKAKREKKARKDNKIKAKTLKVKKALGKAKKLEGDFDKLTAFSQI